jgi:signal transduction histidine kinase
MAALRQHAEAVTARDGGLKVTVSGPAELDALPAAVEVAAYRIVMEAVTNTVRHAHAHNCGISIDLGDWLTIRVVDDGVGLTRKAVPAPGVGLASMAERAAELGGTFDAAAAPGVGTVITAVLPASAPAGPVPRTEAAQPPVERTPSATGGVA